MSYVAVLVAAAAAFILGGAWYAVFGKSFAALQARKAPAHGAAQRMPPWKLAVELVRCLVVAVVLSYLLRGLGTTTWLEAAGHAVCLWVGFPLVLMVGAVVHEDVPWKLAAIHAGDWLGKLVGMAVILGLWR